MTGRRFTAAAERFRNFFGELDAMFVEREDVLAQVALALIGRQHALMTGPPGTAKSKLAKCVLDRIVDEKTGQPSLFSRHITENTVHTDLVGAVDFKTLTETGRTEHFIDEGMAGSVHVFLDEVLDGRDMLLRSTLTLLNEREFRQGKKNVKGVIEVALMTTNRYLSEVLQESRQTLLAFVDRIAYLSFIPKGFSTASALNQVMRAQLSDGDKPLRQVLTLQDVDVLQDTASAVYIAPELSERLVGFLRHFEDEVGAAVRADPQYTPSRYLSTRTMVRAGQALKSIAVHRKVFVDPERPLEVLPDDFEMLRLLLLLSGPSPREASALLQRQDDGREKQQLHIIATERAIFDGCMKKLDRRLERRAAVRAGAIDEATLRESSVAALLELLGRMSSGPIEDPADLERVVRRIGQRIVEEGLRADGELDEHAEALCRSLSSIADSLQTRGAAAELTQWLQGQVLKVVEAQISRRAIPQIPPDLQDRRRGLAEVLPELDAELDAVQALFEARSRLVAAVRSAPATKLEVDTLLEQEIVHRAQRAFLADARTTLQGDARAGDAFGLLKEALGGLEQLQARCEDLFGRPSTLVDQVVGPQLGAVFAASLARLSDHPRSDVLTALDELLVSLARADVLKFIPTAPLLSTAVEALVAQERPLQRAAADRSGEPAREFSLDAYRRLRREVPAISLAFLAAQVCLRLDPSLSQELDEARIFADMARQLAALPAELLGTIEEFDARRLDRPLAFLEAWWSSLRQLPDARRRLEVVAHSRLLEALREESALERFRLEIELYQRLFPPSAAIDALLPRVRALQGNLAGLHQDAGSVLAEEWQELVRAS